VWSKKFPSEAVVWYHHQVTILDALQMVYDKIIPSMQNIEFMTRRVLLYGLLKALFCGIPVPFSLFVV
jgi:hypothetical protein